MVYFQATLLSLACEINVYDYQLLVLDHSMIIEDAVQEPIHDLCWFIPNWINPYFHGMS